MQKQQYLDLPLQRLFPLSQYLPQNGSTDLPLQSNNHYQPSCATRIPTASTHSLSKWAFTQTSTQDNNQQSQQDSGQEIIVQATFKPTDLKKQLQKAKSSTQKQSSSKCTGEQKKGLKSFLCHTLFTHKEITENKDKIIVVPKRQKSKQKYEKILDDFFNKPKIFIKNQSKMKTKSNHDIQRHNTQAKSLFKEDFAKQRRVNSVLPTKRQIQTQVYKSKRDVLPKTYRQPSLKQSSSLTVISQKHFRNKLQWQRLNFFERQSRTLQNKKDKTQKQKIRRQQRQIKQCTFKPVTNQVKIVRGQTASSYAKLYIERIKNKK